MKKRTTRLWRGLLGATFATGVGVVLAGCVRHNTYVYSSIDNPVELQSSALHRFELVRVYGDDDELVVYGKVAHNHSRCVSPAHVDLAILNAQKKLVMRESLPLSDRGTRRRGWAGAAFRTRIPGHPQPGEAIRLAFHDDGCVPADHFDCGDSVAVAPQAVP